MVRSCFAAPETGRKRHLSGKQKGETRTGTCKNHDRTRVTQSPPHGSFVRRLSQPATPTSARDGPHVGTHVCTPLKLYLLFPDSWSPLQLDPDLPSFVSINASKFVDYGVPPEWSEAVDFAKCALGPEHMFFGDTLGRRVERCPAISC
jgi:hypothetical protein